MKRILVSPLIAILFCCCKKESQLNQPYTPVGRSPDLTRNMDTISKYIRGNWAWLEEKRWDQINGGYILEKRINWQVGSLNEEFY